MDFSDAVIFDQLVEAIEDGESEIVADIKGLLSEIQDFLDYEDISAAEFLRLASLSLTRNQYVRLRKRMCSGHTLKELSRNLYLLYEDYEPGVTLDDEFSGEKIDDYIDLFKVDMAMLPHAKYLKRVKQLHTIRATDPKRLRAVIIDVLRRREGTGDCYLEASLVQKEIESYPLFYKTESEYNVKENLNNPGEETTNHLSGKLAIRELEGKKIYYLKSLFDDEAFVADTIRKLLEKDPFDLPTDALREDIDASAEQLTKTIGESFDSEQFKNEREELYSGILNQRFYVLTGSPGSGKSRELLKVIQEFNAKSELSRVLTLTGKAALRLNNNEEGFTGVRATTIDKFLTEAKRSADQGGTSITHNLIIDEASMIDLLKLAELLKFVNTESYEFCRLILVGDENQLPPIGFGKPFADIIGFLKRNRHKYASNIICLDTNCRAELPNEYIQFAQAFSTDQKSQESILASVSEDGSYFEDGLSIKFWENSDDLYSLLDASTQELIDNTGGDEVNDLATLFGISGQQRPAALSRFQILTPNRTGFYGASGINLHYQASLPGGYLSGSIGEIVFKKLDKVMHTHNEYKDNELFVSNGSMGAIVANKRIFFEEHEKATTASQLRYKDHLELAYAITVHKSQGSGFNHVHMVLPEHNRFISRELFYTGLTRAKNQVTLFIQRPSDEHSLERYFEAIRANSAVIHRRTTLLMEHGAEYAYVPLEGVEVKSRVEYIIHRKLTEAKEKLGGFDFRYEETYEVEGEPYDYHPDFVLRFDDGRMVYWEHLGKLKQASYVKNWDKRLQTYRRQGDYDALMTSHELDGISDEKIESIILGLLGDELVSEDSSNRYSGLHVSLR